MTVYNQVKEINVQQIVCDCCGKELLIEDGIIKEDSIHVEKEWGYFSNKDGEVHQFDICEDCYDKIIKQFKCKVDIIEK